MQYSCVALLGSSYFLQPGPLFELQTGPTDYLVLTDLAISAQVNPAATAALWLGLGTPAARGVGVYPVTAVQEDQSRTDSATGTQLLTTWSTLPTVPSGYLRRRTMSLVTGGQNPPDIWRISSGGGGIKILPSSSLVLWLISNAYAAGAGQGQIDATLYFED
jgi:hypothetical protein